MMDFVLIRHPELVSGSISNLEAGFAKAGWMLKQVQHDDTGVRA